MAVVGYSGNLVAVVECRMDGKEMGEPAVVRYKSTKY